MVVQGVASLKKKPPNEKAPKEKFAKEKPRQAG
jgi:hypothetical protein